MILTYRSLITNQSGVNPSILLLGYVGQTHELALGYVIFSGQVKLFLKAKGLDYNETCKGVKSR